MIRPGYRLNDTVLLPIFPVDRTQAVGFPEGLTGFRRMISDWGIDWKRFIDIGPMRPYGDPANLLTAENLPTFDNFDLLQLAYRIDTALVDPLANLPLSVADNPPPSLALRNLLRARRFGLPTGQAVAAAMGVPALSDGDILIGQGVDNPAAALADITTIASGAFNGKCPLWTYVLAEAMHNHAVPDPQIPTVDAKTVSTPQLGPVGGRIVAEVFLGIMFADKGSYLAANPSWTPAEGADYRLKDLVATALKHQASTVH
jgi:hypothetical protein